MNLAFKKWNSTLSDVTCGGKSWVNESIAIYSVDVPGTHDTSRVAWNKKGDTEICMTY